MDVVENGRPQRSSPTPKSQQQMYIAQVLQDPNLDEAGGGSGEEDRGSSQDEDMINAGNSINEADFQSGEDSLIANEVHH